MNVLFKLKFFSVIFARVIFRAVLFKLNSIFKYGYKINVAGCNDLVCLKK